MAANKKEDECIAMFKHLEETHPVRAVQRQAENLRFIMEAPKLEIGEDEKVKVPLMNLDRSKCVWQLQQLHASQFLGLCMSNLYFENLPCKQLDEGQMFSLYHAQKWQLYRHAMIYAGRLTS